MGTKAKPKKRPAVLAPPKSGPRPLRKIDDLPPSLREPARQALIGFVAYAQARQRVSPRELVGTGRVSVPELVGVELLQSHDEKG